MELVQLRYLQLASPNKFLGELIPFLPLQFYYSWSSPRVNSGPSSLSRCGCCCSSGSKMISFRIPAPEESETGSSPLSGLRPRQYRMQPLHPCLLNTLQVCIRGWQRKKMRGAQQKIGRVCEVDDRKSFRQDNSFTWDLFGYSRAYSLGSSTCQRLRWWKETWYKLCRSGSTP